MADREQVKEQVRAAFAQVEPPPHWCLVNSREGQEPFLLEQEFAGKDRWQALDAAFLDQAPGGFGSALSFFSDEAFHFYLPAYLIADLDDRLQRADPVFHLTHGLESGSAATAINPRRYGRRTWRDHALFKFAMFDAEECTAIAAYLEHKRAHGDLVDFLNRQIDEALEGYWRPRAQSRWRPPSSLGLPG